MDSARALVAKGRGIALVSRAMSVSRAPLSLQINHSAGWQDKHCNRRNDEADAEILSNLLDIISDIPGYGYRRVWGSLRRQRRGEGLSPVNAKRLYRLISEHNLLLLDDKTERPRRKQKGKSRLPDKPAHDTRKFARALNLEPCTTAVSSPQSNGMAERFVKKMKEDYIALMPKPDVKTALLNLAAAFRHYNKNHPHSALGYDFPREYRRQRASLT